MKYAEVIFQSKTGSDTCTLTYHIPERLELEIGDLVFVKMRNRDKTGMIWNIHQEKPKFKTLAIEDLARKQILNKHQVELIKWMSKYYLCSLDRILKLFIPKRVFNHKSFRDKKESSEQIIRSEERTLTEEQKRALKSIIESGENTFLVHGVTGSGKTEVYLQLAKHYLAQNKQILILVPEISLTTQTIEYFEKGLGIKASILNSKQSEGEKYHDWMKIWKKQSNLIIGSRSAIFAPLQDPGLIIVDEEHESSYKQDNNPRYSTHAIIEKYQEINPQIKAVYGSATPSIETREKLKDKIIELKERISGSSMPKIEIVDLRVEFQKQNKSIFSERLKEEIQNSLKAKEQVILFINRRGSASSVVCRDCGNKSSCPNCEIPFTFHKHTLKKESLICHHCGKISAPPTICNQCQGTNIRHLGIGTQKIESELIKEFPGIRVLRADKDTTSSKHGFRDIYQKFRKHEADVLVGTQMIAKGLHLPKVNLVGVILADIGLNIPSFNSSERNYQLMTQVAGRAGRSGHAGKVIIQSYNPEHLALICTQNHDYQSFFNYERQQRALLHNPPFGKLAKITIEEESLKKCQEQTEQLEREIWKLARENEQSEGLEINSFPAYITKLKGRYRYNILIKDRQKRPIEELLAKLAKEYIMSPNIKIDIDPIQI